MPGGKRTPNDSAWKYERAITAANDCMGIRSLEKLPAEVIRKSFKVCALSSNLDGSEDDQITCIKHVPCQSLLPRLQAFRQEEEETDNNK